MLQTFFDRFVKRKRYKGPSRHFLDIRHDSEQIIFVRILGKAMHLLGGV